MLSCSCLHCYRSNFSAVKLSESFGRVFVDDHLQGLSMLCGMRAAFYMCEHTLQIQILLL